MSTGTRRTIGRFVMAGVLIVNSAILIVCHDRDWYPPDEGNYAHVAERILSGEVLHRDVQDIHGGYVNFANASAMALLGLRLDSPRKLLALLVLFQSLLIFLMFRRQSLPVAIAASVASTAIGTPQFFNPTANWYCLVLFFLVAWIAGRGDFDKRGRIEILGFLVATIFLFRQLTGVLVALGLVAYLLSASGRVDRDKPVLARATLLIGAAGLIAYLARFSSTAGIVLYGIWPLAILVISAVTVRTTNREALRLGSRLTAGALAGCTPVLVYHLVQGSWSWWLRDIFFAATSLTSLEFFTEFKYGDFLEMAAGGFLLEPFGRAGLACLFWLALFAAPCVNGLLALRDLAASRAASDEGRAALPFLAAFYGLVSLHYAIPVYVLYASGALLCGILASAVSRGAGSRRMAVATTILLAFVALWLYAGQSTTRTMDSILRAQRVELVRSDSIERCGLQIPRADLELYTRVITHLDRNTKPSDRIFALPSNAELYFLARRRSPVRFFNTALGLRGASEVDHVLGTLRRDLPKVVFFNPTDKYNTEESIALMKALAPYYQTPEALDPFSVFTRPDPEGEAP